MHHRSMDRRSLLGGCMAIAGSSAAHATAGGTGSALIELILPFPVDSALQPVARAIVAALGNEPGPPVALSNIGSSRGSVAGTLRVARAAADGSMLLLAQHSHVLSPLLFPKLDYHPLDSFRGVSLLLRYPLVVLVAANGPDSLQALASRLRASPGRYAFGSAGPATSTHLGARLLLDGLQADAQHHPFAGLGQAFDALEQGRILFLLSHPAVTSDPRRMQRLRPLAVTCEERLGLLPTVPTVAETKLASIPQFHFDSWMALLAPSSTPDRIVLPLAARAQAALESEAVRPALASFGAMQATSLSPSEVDQFLAAEQRSLVALAKRSLEAE